MRCRATMVVIIEFDDDEPEVELEQLKELEWFEPLDVIKRAYDRQGIDWTIETSLVASTIEDGVEKPYVFDNDVSNDDVSNDDVSNDEKFDNGWRFSYPSLRVWREDYNSPYRRGDQPYDDPDATEPAVSMFE